MATDVDETLFVLFDILHALSGLQASLYWQLREQKTNIVHSWAHSWIDEYIIQSKNKYTYTWMIKWQKKLMKIN